MDVRVKALIERTYAPQRSDEWFLLRSKILTASDAATALGENPYQKADELLAQKCGWVERNPPTVATHHGTVYEDEARDLYAKQHDEVCHEIGLCVHPELDWLGGSADAITESGKLIEIKCPLFRKLDKNGGDVPKYYMPQVQVLLEVLDLDEAHFVQYEPISKTWPQEHVLTVTHISRDRAWFTYNMPKLKEFWDRVLKARSLPHPERPLKRRCVKQKKSPPPCEIKDEYDEEHE